MGKYKEGLQKELPGAGRSEERHRFPVVFVAIHPEKGVVDLRKRRLFEWMAVENRTITVYGIKKKKIGKVEQTDGIQQKTEKSISHSSSHGGRVFEFPLPAAAYIPISGSVSDGAASPAIGAFLEKRLRISFPRAHRRSHRYDRGVELILLSIFLVGLLAAGGRRFTEELEHFLEELPGRMEELSLLGQQFEQSIERVLHLPAGKIGQLFRGTGLQGGGQVKEILLPQLLQKSVPAAAGIVRAVIVVVLFFIASILSLQEMDELRRRRFDSMFHREFFLLGRRLAVTGSAWLKTQSVIFLMTSAFSMAGLLLIGNPYYILGGIGIGVLDALPIFGAGTALVPWSLFLLFKREWGHALILFGLYLLCYFLREFTEAHLMGKKMGLSPLETLAAIYVGLQLFSLFGFLLGPIGLLIIKDFVEEYGEADEGADAH